MLLLRRGPGTGSHVVLRLLNWLAIPPVLTYTEGASKPSTRTSIFKQALIQNISHCTVFPLIHSPAAAAAAAAAARRRSGPGAGSDGGEMGGIDPRTGSMATPVSPYATTMGPSLVKQGPPSVGSGGGGGGGGGSGSDSTAVGPEAAPLAPPASAATAQAGPRFGLHLRWGDVAALVEDEHSVAAGTGARLGDRVYSAKEVGELMGPLTQPAPAVGGNWSEAPTNKIA